jgi:hypothetical protein
VDFDPGIEAVRREGGIWCPGLVIGHNDAAPYNGDWNDDRLVGFVDWDMSGPLAPKSDLAWVAFSWVPLHARDVVEAEGFTHFSDRRRRLELFLREYGGDLTADGLLPPVAITGHLATRNAACPGSAQFPESRTPTHARHRASVACSIRSP